MTTLRESQLAMASYLTSPPGTVAASALRSLLPLTDYNAERRLAIYKSNVYSRLVDALRDTFPAVERLVGEEFFRFAATEFVAQAPPRAATLLSYGGDFAKFLACFPPARGIPYLSDVAWLEFTYLESYHAADATPLDRDNILAVGIHGRPVLHPSAGLVTSPYQVSRIWELNRNEATFDNVTLPQLREYLLVIRPMREVEVRRLGLGAYSAVLAFADGADVAQARLEAELAEPGFDFQRHFIALADAGTFVAVLGGE